ncbi:methylmalonyl Co-A mutase-associated GTPase MeaB [uncultured Eudoraea sp.]|uniref:methylmalonyl Co-A mutase-associated GTPase MeaB n=1 Tax=uncultured Eudoraea sp. TaxID=1035614 RepID=UPI00260E6971|nr:methylmalonyl Co-A mutase-associated GTPase MeaB [uncultured Eudoraea sp.]
MSSEKNKDTKGVLQVKKHRKKKLSVEDLTYGVLNGDKAILARAITIVESTKNEDLKKAYALIENCLSKESKSIRIGITGVPGVGKSTFIEIFGKTLTSLGKKVAVLAVDPTSTLSKGSILGDKTRMQELVKDPNAFIRPSPSGESLGGVARKTRETVILCEAAGFDIVLIETVGVGQSETAVHSMVDFFLLLKLAGAGDELQGIKRGIMEMADAIVINKAEGDNLKRAQLAKVEFERALQLYPPKENGWNPMVSTCSAIENKGIIEIWEMIVQFLDTTKDSGYFEKNRQNQNKFWLMQTIDELLKQQFYRTSAVKENLESMLKKVAEDKISPFRAAEVLMVGYKKELK